MFRGDIAIDCKPDGRLELNLPDISEVIILFESLLRVSKVYATLSEPLSLDESFDEFLRYPPL